MEFKYGIISTAEINHRFIGAINATKGKVVAIASRNIDKAKKIALQYHIEKAYGSYEELYQDTEVNLVYISTINKEHVNQIKKALHYGKHVLCEKPIALHKKDAIEVFSLAKEKNLFLMEMQKSLFLPVTTIIKEYINSNKLGNLHQVDMSACFYRPLAKWMYDPKQGGVVYGSASYTIEYLDYLIEPKEIIVLPLATKDDTNCIDSVALNIKMDDVLINSRITMKAKAKSFCHFYFDNGYIEVDEYWKARSIRITVCPLGIDEEDIKQINLPIDFEMVYEIKHVEECLENNKIESSIMDSKRSILCCEVVDTIINFIG